MYVHQHTCALTLTHDLTCCHTLYACVDSYMFTDAHVMTMHMCVHIGTHIIVGS